MQHPPRGGSERRCFLGTVTLPWEARFYDAQGRNVWATVTGALDETYVVRYRIEGAR